MNLHLYFPHLLSGVNEIQLKGSKYIVVKHLRISGKCVQRRARFSKGYK
jgi:hypothetical protein